MKMKIGFDIAPNLIGTRYGKLIIIARSGTANHGHSTWLCKCDCGNEKVIRATCLKRGNINSCGCIVSPNEGSYHERLKLKIKINIKVSENGCWIWKGRVRKDGYGESSYRKNKHSKVHHISFLTFKGPIGNGLWVLHKCHIRSCCNPDHLYLGTRLDNSRDMVESGRSNKGRDRPLAKLDEDKVKYCRFMHEFGVSNKQLANFFGVCSQTMHSAVNGQTWKHI